jgi:hypothetical protein
MKIRVSTNATFLAPLALVAALFSCSGSVYPADPNGTVIDPPVPPGSASATALSSTDILVSWSDVANEEGFKLERSTSASSGFVVHETLTANAISYTDTALSASTTYYYRVRATNDAGDSPPSSVVNATTQPVPTSPPAAPSGIAATALSSSSIRVDWTDNSDNESRFQIQRSLSSSSGWNQVGTALANSSAWSDSSLQAGTRYYYRVRAINDAGNSSYTSVASATTQPAASNPPAAPSSLAATAQSSSVIRLTWTDNSSDETGFSLERSLSSSSGFAAVATPAANATSYSDSSLAASTTYYYRLRAANGAGNSSYTSVASATTQAVTPPPTDVAAALAVLAQHSVFFDHASVGMNIMDGVDRLLGSASGAHPTRVSFEQSSVVASRVGNGNLADHYFLAENGYPLDKMSEFRNTDLGSSGLGTKLNGLGGVAVMKLCFADFDSPGLTSSSAVDSAFTTYQSVVSQIASSYPSLKIVHMTSALRSGGNELRERYNDYLRSTYGSRVFDLADVEAGGTHNLQTGLVRTFQGSYNAGDDHLSTAGQDAVARALVLFLAGQF